MVSNYLTIKEKLETALEPDFLEIIDQSRDHAGHYTRNDLDTISHAKVIISSKLFDNKSLLQCHRMVSQSLKQELAEPNGLHALVIEIKK